MKKMNNCQCEGVEDYMKNIALDLMMGLLCVVLTITIIGITFIPDVLEAWKDMRE